MTSIAHTDDQSSQNRDADKSKSERRSDNASRQTSDRRSGQTSGRSSESNGSANRSGRASRDDRAAPRPDFQRSQRETNRDFTGSRRSDLSSSHNQQQFSQREFDREHHITRDNARNSGPSASQDRDLYSLREQQNRDRFQNGARNGNSGRQDSDLFSQREQQNRDRNSIRYSTNGQDRNSNRYDGMNAWQDKSSDQRNKDRDQRDNTARDRTPRADRVTPRSGVNRYDGNHGTSKDRVAQPPHIIQTVPRSSDFKRFRNEPWDYGTNPTAGSILFGNFRVGYVQHDNHWRDQRFIYPHYVFYPTDRCRPSPWYCYYQLPPYITITRIIIVSSPYSWDEPWSTYQYRSGYGDLSYRRSRALDHSLEDLRRVFETGNMRDLDELISNQDVAIYDDGRYSYSLGPDDFYDLVADCVRSVDTNQFRILEVNTYRNDVKIVACHDTTDPWGRQQSIYHEIRMTYDDGRYVISGYSTSPYRPY
ncbi:MAG: hypothetical protein JSS72_01525 [Armatimonadetes bacterium]|nr:hypothetical protein [Armatimonadota bacterium]